MKKIWILVCLVLLLSACSSKELSGPKSVRILEDDVPMFRGDRSAVYDEVEATLALGTQCLEIELATFNVQGQAVDLGYLECGEDVGWVYPEQYGEE